MIQYYNSIEDTARACHEAGNISNYKGDSWTDNCTFKQGYQKAMLGDEAYAQEALAYVDKLEASMPATLGREWRRDVNIGRLNLSEYLANSPTPFRRRVKRESDAMPVKIVVSLTSSAGVSSDTLKKRGHVILALLLKAQQSRSVDLWLLTETAAGESSKFPNDGSGYTYIMQRVETRPLALGQAAFALCSTGYVRMLTYNLATKLNGFQYSWPDGYYDKGQDSKRNAAYQTLRRERLGLDPHDVVVAEAYLTDELLSKPIEWITQQLETINGVPA